MNMFDGPGLFKGRIGYHIFVDRFYREGAPPEPKPGRILKNWDDSIPNWKPDENGVYQNNYFYGGNIPGITVKLDYIKEMGFNLIYLSPLGQSETNHHYDPVDQMQIDPWLGTWKDFQNLCKEAHKRDILVIVDLIFNHMGAESEQFQKALNDPNSTYHDWFEWDKDGKPVFWGGFTNMPQCNKYNHSYQDYTCAVSALYIANGADGIRYDLGENLPEEFMWRQRETVKKIKPNALLIAEAWKLDNHREKPQLDGGQFDSVMNYPLADSIIRWLRYGNAAHFMYNIGEILKYPKEALDVLFNHLDTHDTPRAINLLAGEGVLEDPFKGACWDIEGPWRYLGGFDTYGFRKWELENEKPDMEIAKIRLIMASRIQYFMPGIPIVFAGTEVGVYGFKDPFNRKPYPWDAVDEEIQKHYKNLGEFRRRNRKFFSEAGTIHINCFGNHMEINRRNQYGEMALCLFRNPDNPKEGWVSHVSGTVEKK